MTQDVAVDHCLITQHRAFWWLWLLIVVIVIFSLHTSTESHVLGMYDINFELHLGRHRKTSTGWKIKVSSLSTDYLPSNPLHSQECGRKKLETMRINHQNAKNSTDNVTAYEIIHQHRSCLRWSMGHTSLEQPVWQVLIITAATIVY